MTKKDNKDEEHIEAETSQKDVQSQLKQLTETRTQLRDRLKDFDLEKSKAEKAIDSKQEEVVEFTKKINEEIQEMQYQARGAINAVTKSYLEIKKWLGRLYDNVLKVSFFSIGILMLVVYGHYFVTNEFVFDEIFLTSFIAFPILFLLYSVVHSFKSKLDKKFDASSKLDEAQDKAMEFLETNLNLNPANLEHMKNVIQNVKKVTEKTLSVLRDYIPHADKYFKSLERENRQEVFRRTLANSLVHYGFSLQKTVNDWIQNFSSLKNTEPEWLDKSTGELSKKISIPSVFITLIYSDYVGDVALAKNAWNTIKKNSLLSDFIKLLIRNKVVATEYIDSNCTQFGSIEDLIKDQDTFNLDDFRTIYHTFYFDLAKEKTAFINSLRAYRFKISGQLEEHILKFVPKDLDEDKRKEELFDDLSGKLATSSEIIHIIFFEHEADFNNRIKSWKKIKSEKTLIFDFVKLLKEKELLSIPTQYKGNAPNQQLIEYVSSKFEKLEDFTLKTADFSLSDDFKFIEEKKKYLLRMFSYNNLNIEQLTREEFTHLLPLNDNEITLSEWLTSRTKIDKNIILLFYYEYIQDDKRKDILRTIRDEKQTKILAKILLENDIILKHESSTEKSESEIHNLSLLLILQEDFDRRLIQSLFDKCNKIFDYAKSINKFLETEKLIAGSEIEFSTILNLVNARRVQDILSLLNEIVGQCLKNNSTEKFSEEWSNSISQAVLVLLLVENNDVLQYEACKNAATDKTTVKILYHTQLVRENDSRNAKPPTRLDNITSEVIDDYHTDYTYIHHFQNELKNGILYPNITQLVGTRVDNIYEIVAKKQEKFQTVFRKIKSQLNTFLESKLNYDIVLKSLNLNLVNAYMITSPGTRTKIFGEIIPTYLPSVISDFAKNDSVYKDFLLLYEGISGGKGTRLGIVPLRMSFNEFNNLFNDAFKEAVKRYADAEQKEIDEEEYAANLIRIMPSEAFFKRVIGGAKSEDQSAPDHPINRIGELIRKYYPPEKNLGLVASLSSGEKVTTNMKNLLIDLLNTRIRLFNFVEEEVKPIIEDTSLFKKMDSKEFDNQLIQEFNFSDLSDLCIFVYGAQDKDSVKFKTIFKKIKRIIMDLQKRHRKKVAEDKVEQLVETVIYFLQTWGGIIEGFSEDLVEAW